MSLSEKALLTINEAADQAEVSPVTVRSWIRRGQLASMWFEGRLHVIEIDLLDTELKMRHARRGRKRADR